MFFVFPKDAVDSVVIYQSDAVNRNAPSVDGEASHNRVCNNQKVLETLLKVNELLYEGLG